MRTNAFFSAQAGLAGALVLALSIAHPAAAQSPSFTPAGSQLDGDRILDIAVKPFQSLSFRILLRTAGLTEEVTSLSYSALYHSRELRLRGGEFGTAFDANARSPGDPDPDPGEFRSLLFTHEMGSVMPNSGDIFLASLRFTVQRNLDNDGVLDFALFDEMSREGGLVLLPIQEVEVQPPDITIPEPATILLLGTGLLALSAARLRRGTGRTPR